MRNQALFEEYQARHLPGAIDAIRTLIETCRDGERGYTCAAEHACDEWLRRLFWEYAHQRASFGAALETELLALGGRVEPHPTIAGWIHRKWLDVRSAIDPGSALAMLLECERGENAARVMYERALSVPLPADVQNLLLEQLGEIHDAHDKLDRMRGGSLTLTSTSI